MADMEDEDELTPMPFYSHIPPTPELSDEELERYVMGRIQDESELTQVEHHLISCSSCAERAEEMTGYIAAMIGTLRRFQNEDLDSPA